MKVAVFGAGYWAQFQIAAWQAVGVPVVGIWNRTRERAERAARRLAIPRVYGSLNEAFSDASYDVADIVTGPESHEQLVLAAARYGRDTICQKPMADSLEACLRMTDACSKRGIWFAVHENFRFQPQFTALKRLLLEGTIGAPVSAHLILRSPDRGILAAQPALCGMEHMVYRDMGPHAFDVARYLFGEAERVFSAASRGYPDIRQDLEDEAFSTLRMRSGLPVHLDMAHALPYKARVEGTRGSVVLGADNVLRVRTAEGARRICCAPKERLSYIPYRDWKLHGGHVFAAIPACLAMLKDRYESRSPADTSGEDNIKTMRAVFAAMRSAERGEAVAL